jgi:hypothetical protein
MSKRLLAAAAAGFAALAFTSAACGQTATRAWVSGHGTDATGCGAPTAPCRSLQYVHDSVVASGGEIDVLDPAGYGAIAITKPITIANDGVGTAGVQATSGTAISIALATPGGVVLRGLDIEGVGGAVGVGLTAGPALSIEDCTINGFTFAGVQYVPNASSTFYMSNTRLTNNGAAGVNINPVIATAGAIVQVGLVRVEMANDVQAGAFIDGRNLAPSGKLYVTLADSFSTGNTDTGVHATSSASGAPTVLMVRNSTLINNGAGAFVEANGTSGRAILYLAHSTVSGNATGMLAQNGGVLASYGDNDADGNAAPGSTPTPVAFR